MKLLQASFFSALSTAVKISVMFISVKIISLYTGPAGLARLGQFASFISLVSILAGGGIANGITKYTAEYRHETQQLNSIFNTGTCITLACSCMLGLICILFKNQLAVWLLGSTQYSSIILILAIGQFFIAGNNFLVAAVNGFKEIKKLTLLNITGNICGLFITVFLVLFWHLYGALLALIIAQALLFLVTLCYVYSNEWFNRSLFRLSYDKKSLFKLTNFSLMTLTSAAALPIAQMIIRGHLANVFSWQEVGYWQAVSRISDVYLLFITTTLSVYYLPRLSEITNKQQLFNEILNTYKIILPLIILLAFGIYIFRDLITTLLFSKAFLPMEPLFAVQLIGDVLKISAWLLAFNMLAKAMTTTFIITEVLFSLSYIGLTYFFVAHYGLIGVVYAFAVNYFFYWCTMAGVFYFFMRNNQHDRQKISA